MSVQQLEYRLLQQRNQGAGGRVSHSGRHGVDDIAHSPPKAKPLLKRLGFTAVVQGPEHSSDHSWIVELHDIQQVVARFDRLGAVAKIPGGEIEVILVPVSGLSLSASLSVIKPKYKSFVTASGDFTSNRLAQVPEKQFTIGAHYTLPVPASVGEIRLGADYYHQSEVYFTDTTQGPAFGPDASQKQAGYGLLNIKADWDHIGGSNIGASLYVQNALAEKYLTYGVILYPSLGFNSATVGDPRVFGFELRYSW